MNNEIEIQKLEPADDLPNSQLLEDATNYYLITFPSGKEIVTSMSPRMRNDLELLNIIPEGKSEEETQAIIEGFLIEAARKYTEQGLDKAKQDKNHKFDEGGLDDEF